MADRVKVGIIGVGQIGKHHVGNYKKIAAAEIVAVADINEAEASGSRRRTTSPTSSQTSTTC